MGMLQSTEAPQQAAKSGDAPSAAPQDDEADENNPAYQTAVKFAMDALYGKEAARDVAQAIQSSPDPVEALANTAYEMVTVVDEKTQGQVPDELMVALASTILGEVAEIAQAAGVKVDGTMIAGATQQMLLRYVTEQGLDPTQLQQAMAQVDPAQVGKLIDAAKADKGA